MRTRARRLRVAPFHGGLVKRFDPRREAREPRRLLDRRVPGDFAAAVAGAGYVGAADARDHRGIVEFVAEQLADVDGRGPWCGVRDERRGDLAHAGAVVAEGQSAFTRLLACLSPQLRARRREAQVEPPRPSASEWDA